MANTMLEIPTRFPNGYQAQGKFWVRKIKVVAISGHGLFREEPTAGLKWVTDIEGEWLTMSLERQDRIVL